MDHKLAYSLISMVYSAYNADKTMCRKEFISAQLRSLRLLSNTRGVARALNGVLKKKVKSKKLTGFLSEILFPFLHYEWGEMFFWASAFEDIAGLAVLHGSLGLLELLLGLTRTHTHLVKHLTGKVEPSLARGLKGLPAVVLRSLQGATPFELLLSLGIQREVLNKYFDSEYLLGTLPQERKDALLAQVFETMQRKEDGGPYGRDSSNSLRALLVMGANPFHMGTFRGLLNAVQTFPTNIPGKRELILKWVNRLLSKSDESFRTQEAFQECTKLVLKSAGNGYVEEDWMHRILKLLVSLFGDNAMFPSEILPLFVEGVAERMWRKGTRMTLMGRAEERHLLELFKWLESQPGVDVHAKINGRNVLFSAAQFSIGIYGHLVRDYRVSYQRDPDGKTPVSCILDQLRPGDDVVSFLHWAASMQWFGGTWGSSLDGTFENNVDKFERVFRRMNRSGKDRLLGNLSVFNPDLDPGETVSFLAELSAEAHLVFLNRLPLTKSTIIHFPSGIRRVYDILKGLSEKQISEDVICVILSYADWRWWS